MTASNSHPLIPAVNLGNKPEGAIYTRSFKGRYRNLRILLAGTLALIFFATSWINWNGHQAVLWNLQESQFYIFSATFWPQDLGLLSEILIVSAFILCAVTVFIGRVWCGYTCPQSVWTWVFMWVENLCEGDRNQRIKLDAAPWSFSKLTKRIYKHSLWLSISIATGIAFIGYFVPVRELCRDLLLGNWLNQSTFWVASIASCTYLNAGWLREKVCTHMCPYSRIQSVMFDKDTLVIAYNSARGENRGSRKKEQDKTSLGLGDCVDCSMCVQVCPTGIDIRDGLQLDCIGCAACIDACDTVMDKMGYPLGLISYTSENIQQGQQPAPLFKRPQFLAYTAAVIVLLGSMGFTLSSRELANISVVKDRTPYRINSQGEIVNVYRLKITNKTQQSNRYQLGVSDNDLVALARDYEIMLEPGEIYDVPVAVVMHSKPATGSTLSTFLFSLTPINQRDPITEQRANFTF